MSIAARVVPSSRSFRSLIKKHEALAKSIKDLKALSVLRVCACYKHSGLTDLKRTRAVFSVARAMARDRPSPYGEVPFFFRSAGACPPRSWDCADAGKANPLACACGNLRGPKPYDEGDFCRCCSGRRAALLHRDQEVSPTVLHQDRASRQEHIETGRSLLRGHRLHRDRDGAPTDL